jgi:hypothetical protein
MSSPPISDKDRKTAERCVEFPVCVGAWSKQKGFAFWFVRLVEGSLCPYCKA